MKRIVITGMGLVTPLGCGVDTVWERLLDGRSGLSRLPEGVAPGIGCQVAGRVPDTSQDIAGFDPARHVATKDLRKMDRFIQLAMGAADEAIKQARWQPKDETGRNETATVIASGVGGFNAMADATRLVESGGTRRVSPFLIPSMLINLAAGQISICHQFGGPIGAPVTACAASAQAIGDAARLIHCGEAEVVVCGGAEASLDKVALAGFAAARALSTNFNDTPSKASRPFDRRRDGFVMSEGSGVLILESLNHAKERGAEPLAELVGYGTSADAYHITSGPPDGRGARRAMEQALKQANIASVDIDYINAHATSTPVGDAAEIAAIRHVFGDSSRVLISSTKSATGHTLGAAGAIEAIFTIMALRTGIAPPTLNLEKVDDDAAGLAIVGPQAIHQDMTYALSNAFGFGGVNACSIFRRWREGPP